MSANEPCGQCGHSWTDHRGKHNDYFCRFYVGRYERCHCDAPAVNDPDNPRTEATS